MYPTIHNWSGNDLNTKGFGALADCISCLVTEELNGGFTLELQYPLKGQCSEHLTPGNIIMVKPSHNQGLQPFRISEVKQSFSNSITVYANHISYDMSGYNLRASRNCNSLAEVIAMINDFDWSDQGAGAYHDFTFATDMTSNKSFHQDGLNTLRAWMGGKEGSIIDTYGGEWIYDGFTCFLASRRGEDTGIRISYGKNLAEYEKERTNNEYSHVCAYWKKSETTVFSNNIATGVNCTFRVAYYDASKEYENQPSVAQLDVSATNAIAGINPIPQTIKVTPAQIGGDIIGLGDTVLICYDSVFQTRVIKTVWDALAGAYETLELGTKKENIADTIKSLSSGSSTTSSGGGGGGSVTGVKGDNEATYRIGNVNITKDNIGLGNVGNFKAVSTVAGQGLTSTEKSNARTNIGAGTSNLTIGTTSTTAAAGNHTHTASDIGGVNEATVEDDIVEIYDGLDGKADIDHTHAVTSKTAAGFAPQLPNESSVTKFLRQDGSWAVPPGGGGGGDTVTITPTLSSGEKVADYSINGTSGELYSPSLSDYLTKTGLQRGSASVNITIPANSYKWGSITVPTGRKLICPLGYYVSGTGNTDTVPYAFYQENATTIQIALRTWRSSQHTVTVTIYYLYV